MKILIVGNSQATPLKLANDRFASRLDLNFFVVPGGHGPYLSIKDDKLVVDIRNEKHPAYAFPEDVPDRPLSDFDIIVVSALGYVDGGFAFKNPITTLATLAEFDPIGEATGRELVSRSCYATLVAERLRSHHGMRFLHQLVATVSAPVFVQPFPFPGKALRAHPDWGLARDYANPEGAHAFFCQARAKALKEICDPLGTRILPYPEPVWSQSCFSPTELMRETDLIHPNLEHGRMLLEQLETEIQKSAASVASQTL